MTKRVWRGSPRMSREVSFAYTLIVAQRATLWVCLVTAVVTGVIVELAIGRMSPGREAWDIAAYWSLGLPVMIAAALLFGFLAREALVAIGYAPFIGQFAAMVAKTGVGSMIVPGTFLLAVLGLAGVAAAYTGAFVARRRDSA